MYRREWRQGRGFERKEKIEDVSQNDRFANKKRIFILLFEQKVYYVAFFLEKHLRISNKSSTFAVLLFVKNNLQAIVR